MGSDAGATGAMGRVEICGNWGTEMGEMGDGHLFPLTLPCWSKPGGSSDRAPREQIVCIVCPVVGWVGLHGCPILRVFTKGGGRTSLRKGLVGGMSIGRVFCSHPCYARMGHPCYTSEL